MRQVQQRTFVLCRPLYLIWVRGCLTNIVGPSCAPLHSPFVHPFCPHPLCLLPSSEPPLPKTNQLSIAAQKKFFFPSIPPPPDPATRSPPGGLRREWEVSRARGLEREEIVSGPPSLFFLLLSGGKCNFHAPSTAPPPPPPHPVSPFLPPPHLASSPSPISPSPQP